MIALASLAWATVPDREPAKIRLERIDLISEDPGTWLIDEIPRSTVAPRSAALRWMEQIRFGVVIPDASLVVGVSVASQSIAFRRPLLKRAPVYAQAGISTSLGLPRGGLVGVEAWTGPVRFGLGVHAMSQARWARPRWDQWRVVPGVGIGFGQSPFAAAQGGRLEP